MTKLDIVLRTARSRKWKAFNGDDFRSDLSTYFPDAESAPAHAAAIGYADTLVEFYDSTISALLDRQASGCDVTFRERRSNDWFDDVCHDAKIRARYLERQFQRTKSPIDRTTWENSVKAMHLMFNTKRSEATMKSIADAQGDSRDLWRAIDRTMGRTVSTVEYVHTADDFGDFLANKIVAMCLETANAPPPIYAITPPAVLSDFATVRISHVIELIGLATCKHCELDPLPIWLLKQCSQILAPYLVSTCTSKNLSSHPV